eukprot:scaffold266830_cov23-Tisochrysis_lutea.AAC.2
MEQCVSCSCGAVHIVFLWSSTYRAFVQCVSCPCEWATFWAHSLGCCPCCVELACWAVCCACVGRTLLGCALSVLAVLSMLTGLCNERACLLRQQQLASDKPAARPFPT